MKKRLAFKSKRIRHHEAERRVIEAALRFSKFTGGPVGIFSTLMNLRKLEAGKKGNP